MTRKEEETRQQLQLQQRKKEKRRRVRRKHLLEKKKNPVEVGELSPLSLSSLSSSSSYHQSSSLPSILKTTLQSLQTDSLRFQVHQECTSIAIVPSGRTVVVGFMDGTLRLLDTTGNFQPDSHQYYQDDDNDDDDDDDDDDNNNKNNNSNKNNINDDPSPPRAPIEERNNSKNALMEMQDLFDCDSSSSSSSSSPSTTRSKSKYTKSTSTSSSSSSPLPIERDTRGIIACQIRARGVITSLLMDVAVSQDGLYAFGGVLKGSTELVAVDLTKIELYHDLCSSTQHYNNKNKNTSILKIDKKKTNSNNSNSKYNSKPKVNVLNLIDVHRHSDAKLKGFGACTRLLRKNDDDRPEYLLFTGKGIKNIHIWSFLPPLKNKKVSSKQTSSSSSSSSLSLSLSSDEAIWTCLYDTPTNGNTITHLHFRYDTNYVLRAISKSDDQKLRVWDLSPEQHRRQQQCHNNDTGTTTTSTDIHYKKKKEKNDTDDISSSVYVPAPAVTMFSTLVLKRGKDILKRKKSSDHTICNYTNDFDSNNNSQWKRPRRPEYIDVKSTENVLGVFGPYAFSGGAGMNDRMCVTCLDAPDLQCPFNRTEFALPGFDGTDEGNRSSRSGRKQRGDLKSVVHAAGLAMDGGHVILELSDGTLVHYFHNDDKESSVKVLPLSLSSTMPSNHGPNDIIVPHAEGSGNAGCRKICVSRIGSDGIVVMGGASYNTNTGWGEIVVRRLCEDSTATTIPLRNDTTGTSAIAMKGFWGFHGVTVRKSVKVSTSSKEKKDTNDTFTMSEAIVFQGKSDIDNNILVHADKEKDNEEKGDGRKTTTVLPKKVTVFNTKNQKNKLVDKSAFETTKQRSDALRHRSLQLMVTPEPKKKYKNNRDFSSAVDLLADSTQTITPIPSSPIKALIFDHSEKDWKDPVPSAGIAVSPEQTISPAYGGSTDNQSKKLELESIVKYFHPCSFQEKESKSKNKQKSESMPKTDDMEKVENIFCKTGRSTRKDKYSSFATKSSSRIEKSKDSKDESRVSTTIIEKSGNSKVEMKDRVINKKTKTKESIPEKKLNSNGSKDTMEKQERKKIVQRDKSIFIGKNDIQKVGKFKDESKSLSKMLNKKKSGNDVVVMARGKHEEHTINPNTNKEQKNQLPNIKMPPSNCQKQPLEMINNELVSTPCYNKEQALSTQVKKRSRNNISLSPSSNRTPTSPVRQSDMETFLLTCHKRKRPNLMLNKNKTSIKSCFQISESNKFKSKNKINYKTQVFDELHEDERRVMVMHHRASHERFRDQVLGSAEQLMNICTVDVNKVHTRGQISEGAKTWWNDTMLQHEQMLEDLLFQQQMEASALSSKQTIQNNLEEVYQVPVSFPFLEVFIQANQAVHEYLFGNVNT